MEGRKNSLDAGNADKTGLPILIQSLLQAKSYPHPVSELKLIETQISWVILTGEFVYKIKKPVNFGFVDFSTLEKRKFYCEEELRVNQTLASKLYLGVVNITSRTGHPQEAHIANPHQEAHIANPQIADSHIAGHDDPGEVLEYAVLMRQFPEENLFSQLLSRGKWKNEWTQAIATQIATLHQQAKRSLPPEPFGEPVTQLKEMLDNFQALQKWLPELNLEILESWTKAEFHQLKELIQTRQQQGWVRDCHGDLNTSNIAIFEGKVLIFDRIEFNLNFRIVDVMNEIAFLTMDLKRRAANKQAILFLNAYLTHTGDYEGLPLLKFYEVYRAMVKTKVAYLKAKMLTPEFTQYLDLAADLTRGGSPRLILLSGLSGSGKTWVAKELSPAISAIHLRSDVERKRLFSDLKAPQLYTEDKTEKTFERLYTLAQTLLKAGMVVIVDAAFLRKGARDRFVNLAQKLECGFTVLQCTANEATLKQRIQDRRQQKQDFSDATVEVLEQQMKIFEPITEAEKKYAIVVDTTKPIDTEFLSNSIINK